MTKAINILSPCAKYTGSRIMNAQCTRLHYLLINSRPLAGLLLLCLCASGCTAPPSDEHIKVQIARHILPQAGEDIFAVENFQKLDGRLNEDKSYSVEVSYDLVFRKSLDEISAELSADAARAPFEAMDKGLKIFAKVMEFGNFKAGDRIHKREIYRFIKTEKSWRLTNEFRPVQ